jgi:hypothetical protein
VPRRSHRIPPIGKTKILPKEVIPQTEPICTTLRFKSWEISLKRTDRPDTGNVETSIIFKAAKMRMNQLLCGDLLPVVIDNPFS